MRGGELTDGLRQAVDALTVSVRLVPDEGVGQVGLGGEPFLEKATHHRHHQVNLAKQHWGQKTGQSVTRVCPLRGHIPHLHQVERYRRLRHGHFEDGFIPRSSRAQVDQVQVAARYGSFLL